MVEFHGGGPATRTHCGGLPRPPPLSTGGAHGGPSLVRGVGQLGRPDPHLIENGVEHEKDIYSAVMTSPEYRRFIEDLKARVISARICAARAVNRDIILLYWDIGHGIVEKQETLGWGHAVVEMAAADLRQAFPEIRGFSLANVWRMRQLHMVYSVRQFSHRLRENLETAPPGKGCHHFWDTLSQKARPCRRHPGGI